MVNLTSSLHHFNNREANKEEKNNKTDSTDDNQPHWTRTQTQTEA